MLDRGAKTWIAHRMVVYVKHNRHAETERLRKVRDLIATVRWEDLAPCKGCCLPCEKAKGVSCEECGTFLTCERACDPWAVAKCGTCARTLCLGCAKVSLATGCAHCAACLPSPPVTWAESPESSSDLHDDQ